MTSPKTGPHFSLGRGKKNLFLTATVLTLGFLSWPIQCWAAVSAADVVSAIENGKILATGTRVSAAVNGTEVLISTYKNVKATDADCKIEAVLMAKTAMDLAPDTLTRATVFFFSTANINKHKTVTVSAGDIKAFGSGQLGQEQLLSSMVVKNDETSDPATRLTSELQQGEAVRSRHRFESRLDGQTMIVSAELDPGMTERDLRYEAVKIAEKALSSGSGTDKGAGTSAAKQVTISFIDPLARTTLKQVSLDASQVKNLDLSIEQALTPIQIATQAIPLDVQSLTAIDGDEKAGRDGILASIKILDKQGVGVTPFVKAFFEIEQQASAGDNNPQLKPSIDRLAKALDEQVARSKNAKDFKPVGDAKASTDSAGSAAIPGAAYKNVKTKTSRYAGGQVMTDGEILTDYNQALKVQEQALGGGVQAEQNPRFGMAIKHAAEVLSGNNRPDDAKKLMARFEELRVKYKWP